MNDIAVIGAGVSGLTTALVLIEKFPKIQNITILAREIINDTAATDLQHEFTSWAAGANHMSFASKEDTRQQQFDLITYKRFMRLGREVKQSACEEVSEISDSELEYRGLDPLLYKGFEYLTCTITPYIYLSYLRTELEKTGKVKIIKSFKSFESFKEIETFLGSKPDLIINCTGLGARRILSTYACEEEEVTNKILPYKGQICVINKDLPYQVTVENLPSEKHVANYVKTIKGAYQFSHIFPRSDGYCIVGGVSLPNIYDNFKSEEVSKSIISNIKQFVPELEEDGVPIQVTFDYVALRPGRKGGVRLEYKKYGDCDVVHNYGIGGAGFQASLGLANEVARIIKTDFLQKTSKL
ncbi:hypothetical protein ACO0SA_002875 [Hanseniaspora valbyensis]